MTKIKWSANVVSVAFKVRVALATIAIAITICAQWIAPASKFDSGNDWLRDHFARIAATAGPETRITIVDVDEGSLARLGPWPWPRARLADLLENLIGPYGARGVALDMVFPQPMDTPGDARIGALAQHGPVVLAQTLAYDSVTQSPLRVGTLSGGAQTSRHVDALIANGFVANQNAWSGAQHVGNIGFVPDSDGIIRRLPMWSRFGGKEYPSLTLSLFNCCSGHVSQEVESVLRVPFARSYSAYTVVPAASVLEMSAPRDVIKDRLVLLGSSTLSLGDRVATPLDASTSGVLVHAEMLSYLLDLQSGHAPAPWPGRWIACAFAGISVLISVYCLPRLSALVNVGILALGTLVWTVLAYHIVPHDSYFSTSSPILTNLFLLGVAVPFDWQMTQRKSRKLLGTLNQYVAKAVVDELLRRDLKDPLAPVQCQVTTLIADMEAYTTHVESLPIEDAANLTRDFLACLTEPVLTNQGTLDKFTGDGLVAFWGAPLPVSDHADLALDAAVQMLREVRAFNAGRKRHGKAPVRLRIGVESGLAMAGDFGSASRGIYTAVGDSVNVASRLEDLARNFPYDLIIGAGTAEIAQRHKLKSLGKVMLRGREKATEVFTLEKSP